MKKLEIERLPRPTHEFTVEVPVLEQLSHDYDSITCEVMAYDKKVIIVRESPENIGPGLFFAYGLAIQKISQQLGINPSNATWIVYHCSGTSRGIVEYWDMVTSISPLVSRPITFKAVQEKIRAASL